MQNLKRKISKIYQNLINKRHLRADVLSLLSSALRPRLLSDQSTLNHYIAELKKVHVEKTIFGYNRGKFRFNVAKIVALSTILGISGLFSFISSDVVFADSLTLTIPSSPLSLDLNPSVNNGFAITSGSFNVKTDNSAGYTTSIKSKNESGDNSLINGNNKLLSISSAISEDTFKNGSEYLNMWGWLPNKLNSEDNTNYQVAPGTEEVVLDKAEEANGDNGTDYNISLAAKVAGDTPTGTYTNTFVVTALSNASPQKEYEPTECWGLSEDQTGSMTDPRDGETYTIARLKDGKCWMTENLRITGSSTFESGHSATLTSNDSDVSSSFTLPTSDRSKFNIGSNGNTTTEGKNNDAAYVETVSYSDPTYGAKSFESGYYTWHTATAGTGTAGQTTQGWNAPSSICPKGWKLPTGGSGGDFQTLTNAYNISDNTAGSNTLRGAPLNFTYAGFVSYSNGSMATQGSYGYYWSSTVLDQNYAYGLYFNSSYVGPANNNGRPYGLPVRCVARGEKPENKGTMQTVDQWGDSVQEGETVLAIDSRDDSVYSVSRLKDGRLWMTQNLRIVGKSISSSNSDVSNSYTIPSSALWSDSNLNGGHVYYNNNPNYGAWYTWYAATAGTGTASMTSSGQNATSSICPKGWKLPTGGSGGDFQTLAQAYNINGNAEGSKKLRGVPLNFAFSGGVQYNNGSLYDQGSGGYYWSSTAYDQSNAYYLGFSSSNVNPSGGGNRSYGFAVRCVQRGPKKITDLQYMQDWNDLTSDEKKQVLNSMKEGTQYTLTDNRDNTQYTVAKLKDGKIWMTQNLAITGSSSFQPGHSATLTSSDSDVSSNYTIPTSNISKFNTNGDYTSNTAKNNDAAYAETVSYTDSVHGVKSFESGYYTWYTATAGTGTASITSAGQNATSSICPKGWKLPTGGSGGDFQTLTNAHSISSNTDGSNTLRGAPLNFTNAGLVVYSSGSMYGQGSYGYYWSSTVFDQHNVYYLYFDSGNVSPTGNNNRPFGRSVRCVAREPSSSTCFTSGTLVDTPKGHISIENIKEGMTVYSYDVNSSKLVEDKVVKTLNDNHDQTVILTFEDESTIHVSYNHEFYDLDKKEWKIIGDFKAGDRLKTVDGAISTIKSIVEDPNKENVYNFETENYHNYFVFSKDTNNRYLVHNYPKYK